MALSFTGLPTLCHAEDSGWVRAAVAEGVSVRTLLVDGGQMYAATLGGGVFKSTDGARTWQVASRGLAANDVLALARTVNGTLLAGTDAGVYQSRDGGANWQPLLAGLQRGHALLAVYGLQADAAGNVFAATDNGVFRLAADGSQWQNTGTNLNRRVNALTLDSEGVIWAATDGGVWKSTDQGANWQPHGSGIESYVLGLTWDGTGSLYAATMGQGVLKLSRGSHQWQATDKGLVARQIAAIAGDGKNWLYAASADGVYRSNDGGASWTLSMPGQEAGNVQSLLVAPSGNVYAGTANGLFRSTDRARRWTPAQQGLYGRGFYALAVDAAGSIYAGGDNGVFVRPHGSGNWQAIQSGLNGQSRITTLVSDHAGNVLAGSSDRGVFRISGNSWISTATGPSRISGLAADQQGNLYASDGYLGVFFGAQGGKRWETINQGLPTTRIDALCRDASGLLLASSGATIFQRTTGGAGWTSAQQGYTGTSPIRSLLCASGDRQYAATASGLYQRKGGVWRAVEGMLGQRDIRGLSQDRQGVLYVATPGEDVYSSRDGDTWQVWRTGLASRHIFAALTDRHGSNYAATNHGIFQYTAPDAMEKPLQISGSASGGKMLRLSADVQAASGDIGKQSNIYVVATLPDGSMFALSENRWQPFNPASVPVYARVTLGTHHFDLLDGNADVTAFKGASILVGYGNDASEVIGKKQFGVIYTVP